MMDGQPVAELRVVPDMRRCRTRKPPAIGCGGTAGLRHRLAERTGDRLRPPAEKQNRNGRGRPAEENAAG